MKTGKCSVSILVNGLGSNDRKRRAQVAQAIAALREHYITSLQKAVTSNWQLAGKSENPSFALTSDFLQWSALETLSYLRPSNDEVLNDAALGDMIAYAMRKGNENEIQHNILARF
jgi:hypothetical protein